MTLTQYLVQLILVCTLNAGFAQLKTAQIGPGNCEGTEYVIKENQGLQGLFDTKKRKFIVEPSLSVWVYDPNTAYAIKMDENWEFDCYNLLQKDSLGNPTLFFETFEIPTILHGTEFNEEDFGGEYYLDFKQGGLLGDLQEGYQTYPGSENELTAQLSKEKKYHFTFDLTNDSLIVFNNMSQSYAGSEHFNSGVFDLKTKAWVIKQNYSKIKEHENYFFCLEKNEKNQELCHIYKIEQIKGKASKLKLLQSLNTEADFDTKLLYESAKKSKNGNCIIFEKEGKLGLFELGIFDAVAVVDIGLEELAKPKFEQMIEIGEESPFFIGINAGVFQIFAQENITISAYDDYTFEESFYIFGDGTKDGWRQLHLDEVAVHLKAKNEFGKIINNVPSKRSFKYSKVKSPENKLNARLGVEKISDDIIYIQVREEFDNQYAMPMMSSIFGEDSLDENGNLVYYPADPPNYKSGIYNFRSNEWKIPNQYERIEITPEAYICSYYFIGPDGNRRFEYHIYDINFTRMLAKTKLLTKEDLQTNGVNTSP